MSHKETKDKTGVSYEQQEYWYRLYETHGIGVFEEIEARKRYSKKEREEILEHFLKNGNDALETAVHFKMKSKSTIYSWIYENDFKCFVEGRQRYKKLFEIELEAAKEIEAGNKDVKTLSEKYNLHERKIKYFIRFVEKNGIAPFDIEERLKGVELKQKEKVLEEFENGSKESSVKLALKYKVVSRYVVDLWKKEFNAKRRRRVQENKKEILSYYEKEGRNQRKTAKRFNIPLSTLNNLIQEKYPDYKERRNDLKEIYNRELELAKEIYAGNADKRELSKKYNIRERKVSYFIKYIKVNGIEDFEVEKRLEGFDEEKMTEILKEIYEGGKSRTSVCIKHHIVDSTFIDNWKTKERRKAERKELVAKRKK